MCVCCEETLGVIYFVIHRGCQEIGDMIHVLVLYI